jgi:hypothetical protein
MYPQRRPMARRVSIICIAVTEWVALYSLSRSGQPDIIRLYLPAVLAFGMFFWALRVTRIDGAGKALLRSFFVAVGLTVISTFAGVLICGG